MPKDYQSFVKQLRRRRRNREHRRLLLESLEPRQLMTTSMTGLAALTINVVEDEAFLKKLARFDSTLDGSQYVATMNWGDGVSTPAMVVREQDGTFGVYGQHTYADLGNFQTSVSIYEVDEDVPESQTLPATASVTDGTSSFNTTTIRPLPQNVEMVEAQPYSDEVFRFVDTNTSRVAGDYSATITFGSSYPGIVTQDANGTFVVTPATPMTHPDEYNAKIQVEISAGSETIMGESSVLVIGAPIHASSVTIPTPTDSQGQYTMALSAVIATFADDNPNSEADDFDVVVYWGDGEFTDEPTGWITKRPDGVYEVYGQHYYGRPGLYSIEVQVYEDDHSRDAAISTVYIQAPPMGPPPTSAWANFDCHGHDTYGQGPPLLGPTTVTDKSVGLFGRTVHASRGTEGTFVVGQIVAQNALSYTVTIHWGDGTGPSSGSVGANGDVTGTHTYVNPGTYAINVSVDVHDEHMVYEDDPFPHCPIVPRTRNYTVSSGATVENPAVQVTATDWFTFPDDSIHAGDLFTVTGAVDEAVATIEWGDGSVEVVGLDAAGVPLGSHAYAEPGFYKARITVRQRHQLDVAHSEVTISGGWTNPLVPQAGGLETTAGEELSDVVVAVIRDQNPRHIGGLHHVDIDWGDGFRTVGRIVQQAGDIYEIRADHTYLDAGAYRLRFDYVDQFDRVAWYGTALVSSADLASTATITNAGLFAERRDWQVAAFSVSDLSATASAFRATIDWGDGSGMTAGHISGVAESVDGLGNPLRTFIVSGTHTYGWAGEYDITVYLEDGATTDKITKLSTEVTVGETSEGLNWPFIRVGEYEIVWGGLGGDVKIIWGDGSLDTHAGPSADLTFNTAFSLYMLLGWHIYQQDGSMTLTSHFEGTEVQRDIFVADGVFNVTEVRPLIYALEGEPLVDVKMLTFTKSEFDGEVITARVDWGDGSIDLAAPVGINDDNTLFVAADHQYETAGIYDVTVTLESTGLASRVVRTQAIVQKPLKPAADRFAAARDVSTGDIPLVVIPAADWGAPWLGLPGPEADAMRAVYDPNQQFFATIDWGVDPQVADPITRGRLYVDSADDLIVYGQYTYAGLGDYIVSVHLDDGSGIGVVMQTPAKVVDWGFDAYHRTNGFGEGFTDTVGQAVVALNTGDLRLSHDLDFDISPGAGVGGNPALNYNSNTAHSRPIIESVLSTPPQPAGATQFDVSLTWHDRGPVTVVRQNTTGNTPQAYLVSGQIPDGQPVEQSGLYEWALQVRAEIGADGPLYVQQSDTAEVVVHAQGDLNPEDSFDHEPFYGVGWDISGLHRLIPHLNGDVLWVSANGESRRYTRQPNGSYANGSPSDFGQLVFDPLLVQLTYTAKNQTKYVFNHLGLLTSVKSPSQPAMQYEYDAEGRLSKVIAPDAAEVTFAYNGFRLQTIHETGGRDLTLTHGGSITRIEDVDGTLRNLTYDGQHHLTNDSWGILTTDYSYDPTTDLLISVDRGLGSIYSVVASAGIGADTAGQVVELGAEPIESVSTDPLGRMHHRHLDQQGRILGQQGPDGVALSGEHARAFARHPDNRLLDTYTGPEGSRAFGPNADGDFLYWERCDLTCPKQSYEYDGTYHALTKYFDENGHVTQFARNQADGVVDSITDADNKTIDYEWDNGLVTVTTNRLGIPTYFIYDNHRRLLQTTNYYGHTTKNTYDAAGNLSSMEDQLGRVTEYEYDQKNRLKKITDAHDKYEVIEYHPSGHEKERTNKKGVKTKYSYDQRGFLVEITEASGTLIERTRSKQYDLVGNVLVETDPRGHSTVYGYDTLNRMVHKQDAELGQWAYQYDGAGNLVTEIDPLNRTTTHEYDVDGRRTRSVDALHGETTWSYDGVGNLLSSKDAEVRVTTHTYDVLNRRTSTLDPAGGISAFTFDAEGNLLTESDPLGRVTTHTYDALNRRTASLNALGGERVWNYDAVGNVISDRDELGRVTTHTYDALNRRTTTQNALLGTKSWTYDVLGNVLVETDEMQLSTSYTFDELNRRTSVMDADTRTESYLYDANDNLVAVVNKRNHVTSYAYDKLNRRITETNALGQPTKFVYDAVGNVIDEYDELNRRTQYVYDDLNRLIVRQDALNEISTRAYDKVGNLVSERDEELRETSYGYDPFNRRINRTDAQSGTYLWNYDAVGNLVQEIDELGRSTDYFYDKLNRQIRRNDALGKDRVFAYLCPCQVPDTEFQCPSPQASVASARKGSAMVEWVEFSIGA